MAKKISDVQKASGLGYNATREGIKRGELPGHMVGRRYVCTDEWYEDWLHGRWVPEPKSLVHPVRTNPTMLHTLPNRKETA